MFFEGSEKKVEIILNGKAPSLRQRKWDTVVSRANATVLSTVHNELCDAYLLSESSLFVYDRSVIMITCGTTTLISAIEEMLTFIDIDDIGLLMYERKNEYVPEAQPTDFSEDVNRLRRFVPGEVFSFGDSEDSMVYLFHYHRQFQPPGDDMTLELLMHGMPPESQQYFGIPKHELYQETDIHRIFSGFAWDDHRFDPVGYSLNAIKDREYYTIHVTPEKGFSYASFETNHCFEGNLEKTIERVLGIFRPKYFYAVLFEQDRFSLPQLSNYTRIRQTQTASGGYRIHFGYYDTNPEQTKK